MERDLESVIEGVLEDLGDLIRDSEDLISLRRSLEKEVAERFGVSFFAPGLSGYYEFIEDPRGYIMRTVPKLRFRRDLLEEDPDRMKRVLRRKIERVLFNFFSICLNSTVAFAMALRLPVRKLLGFRRGEIVEDISIRIRFHIKEPRTDVVALLEDGRYAYFGMTRFPCSSNYSLEPLEKSIYATIHCTRADFGVKRNQEIALRNLSIIRSRLRRGGLAILAHYSRIPDPARKLLEREFDAVIENCTSEESLDELASLVGRALGIEARRLAKT